jgi:hypothetical protein
VLRTRARRDDRGSGACLVIVSTDTGHAGDARRCSGTADHRDRAAAGPRRATGSSTAHRSRRQEIGSQLLTRPASWSPHRVGDPYRHRRTDYGAGEGASMLPASPSPLPPPRRPVEHIDP